MHRNRVFLDSSFWIAFRDARQSHHSQARAVVAALFRERAAFVSTPFVFAETHATFARSRAIREAIIADFWDNPLMHLAEVTDSDHREALDLLRGNGDKSYPFCDAISFVIIRRLELRRVAAFDDHFRQFGGFELLA